MATYFGGAVIGQGRESGVIKISARSFGKTFKLKLSH